MISRNWANIYIGKNPFDLSHIKCKYVYIDTLDKFKKYWKIISKSNQVALDIEAANLSVKGNTISSFQFALDDKLAYFLPYLHPETPFSKKDLEYIKKEIRKWLGRKIEHNYKKPKKTSLFVGSKHILRS